jgi:hypothetical protein
MARNDEILFETLGYKTMEPHKMLDQYSSKLSRSLKAKKAEKLSQPRRA